MTTHNNLSFDNTLKNNCRSLKAVDENNRFFIEIRKIDYLVLGLVWFLSYFVFANARYDFSYDYFTYINYFDYLETFSVSDFIDNLIGQLPTPYVALPPAGLIEVGFAFLSWSVLSFVGSSSIAFAIIASSSLTLRLWILRKLGVHWSWSFLINLYAITLFEANAIRLACGFTLTLLAILFLVQNRSILYVIFTSLLAISFHFQLVFALTLILIFYYGQPLLLGSTTRLLLTIGLLAVISAMFYPLLNAFGLVKINEYMGIRATSAGTITSILGICIWLSVIWHLAWQPSHVYLKNIFGVESRLWNAVVLSGVPSLVIYVSVDNFGAMGERFWQVSFATMISLCFFGKWKRRLLFYQVVILFFIVLIASINVVYRYPLSNYFYPFVPYVNIVPEAYQQN